MARFRVVLLCCGFIVAVGCAEQSTPQAAAIANEDARQSAENTKGQDTQVKAISEIERLGGSTILRSGKVVEAHLFYEFSYDHESPANPEASDDDLGVVRNLPTLQRLFICDGPFTDAGLQHLTGLDSLVELSITSSQHGFYRRDIVIGPGDSKLGPPFRGISSDGLVHIRNLTNLKILNLNYAKVDDAGLLYLHSLRNLEELHVRGTHVSSAGVARLQRALANCQVYR